MRAFAAALLLGLSGCGSEDQPPAPRFCTAAGCSSGLGIVLSSPPAAPYRVDASAGADTRSRNCSSSGCGIFFTDFLPARATIAVVAASGTASYDVSPRYAQVRPNGAGCPPECTQAEVTVSGVIGAVSVYKSAGSVQCAGGGLTPAQMQLELTGAGISVISAACGVDGNAHIAVCGASDGRINIYEVQTSDVAAAQALGFALLSGLPNATRVAC